MRRTTRLSSPGRTVRRRGVASAELAVVLSTLTFICLATCDYARSIFATVTVANCARNGALYSVIPTFAAYDVLHEPLRMRCRPTLAT